MDRETDRNEKKKKEMERKLQKWIDRNGKRQIDRY